MVMHNLAFVTETFFPAYVNNPDKINWGHCYNWALAAYFFFKEKVKHHDVELFNFDNGDIAHAFIRIGAYYYDAETPDGVLHWSELRFFLEQDEANEDDMWPEEEEDFFKFWDDNGGWEVWSKEFILNTLEEEAALQIMPM